MTERTPSAAAATLSFAPSSAEMEALRVRLAGSLVMAEARYVAGPALLAEASG